MDLARTEFGFERTICACVECTFNCLHLPGYLIPADLERMYQATRLEGQTVLDWAQENLMASPGAIVVRNRKLFRIPTLVPTRKPDGSCRFLSDGRCAIHAVSPFGCAFVDAHMPKEKVDRISSQGLQAVLESHLTPGLYHEVWLALWQAGLQAPAPEESRTKMKAAWEGEQR
jgi:hypothetical protein